MNLWLAQKGLCNAAKKPHLSPMTSNNTALRTRLRTAGMTQRSHANSRAFSGALWCIHAQTP
jgi:hypothetical protein